MASTKQREFKAETRKVLNILTHSLYTNKEIFLRELVSNASDALDKLRFMQGRGEAPRAPELPLEIRLHVDKVQGTLTITDTGIGMTEEELIANLGTIAKSGSEAFASDMKAQKEQNGSEQAAEAEQADTEQVIESDQQGSQDAAGLIGRFGIGFYAVFMVADKVTVTSRPAFGDAVAHVWSSDGEGSFTVTPADPHDTIERGTTITAYIKESEKDFLEQYRLESIIRNHSSFIGFPIFLEDEHLNTTPALWREPKFSITKEQYAQFYSFLTYDQKPPLETVHLSVDAPVQFSALLFIPESDSQHFGVLRDKWGLDLYVHRVLIERENKLILPEFLAFLKGVVDTEDLPLNISRETLQDNIVLRKIAQTVTKQALTHLENMAEKNPEAYATFWKHHGHIFKLGYSDFVHRERIAKLLRFNASSHQDASALTSLTDYIARAKQGQKEIWYLAAPNREAAKVSPYLEVFAKKGLEVLFLYEPVDEFALETLGTFENFTFKAIEHADPASFEAFNDVEEETKLPPLDGDALTAFEALLGTIKTVLGDKIKDVRVSKRLADSPACLASPDDGITSSMDKIMRVLQKDDSVPQKILEVNRDHPLMRTLLRIHKANSADPQLTPMIQTLFDATLLLDGFMQDPYTFASRTTKFLENASAWYAEVKRVDE